VFFFIPVNIVEPNTLKQNRTMIDTIEHLLKPRYKTVSDIESGMYSVCDEGYVFNNQTGKRLKTYLNKKDGGYVYVKLQDGKEQRSFHVGVLVAKAFVDNPENKPTVNHDDGNKQNNHHTNLKWATYKENSEHAFKKGLGKSGFDHYSSKFSHEDFWEIKPLKEKGLKNFEIARLYNVSETAVRNLVLGNSYKHIEAPKFDLLAPRFKVKINYPFSVFKVGDIITTSTNSFLYRTLIKFPEIFSKLEWWEERSYSELHKYIAWYDPSDKTELLPKYFEVLAWGTSPNTANILRCHTKEAYFFIADCKPATEAEYNNQKQKP
jgi:hypothetical protein